MEGPLERRDRHLRKGLEIARISCCGPRDRLGGALSGDPELFESWRSRSWPLSGTSFSSVGDREIDRLGRAPGAGSIRTQSDPLTPRVERGVGGAADPSRPGDGDGDSASAGRESAPARATGG